MENVQLIPSAITLSNTSGLPATDLIDDFTWTLNTSQSVTHAVAERMHHASFRDI